MSNWKKAAYLIAAVILFVVIKLWFHQIDKMAEQENYPYEIARQERERFEKLILYCRENENMYTEMSEQVFDYLNEGLSIDEACTAMENNATSEQKEILEQTFLRTPNNIDNYEEAIFSELEGNGLYYIRSESIGVKVIYIHEYSEETEKYIFSRDYTRAEKINDHLYVCYTAFPYFVKS